MGNKGNKRAWRIGILLAVMACGAAGWAYCSWFGDGYATINLWLTPDQQGRYYFEKKDYAAAAERFQDPLWKGVAYYRNKNYKVASEQFAAVDTAEGCFNLGNAYARLGQFEQAVTSYGEALQRRPDYQAAKENRDLVQSLIRKKKAKEKEENPPEGQDPTFNPDEVKFDEKGKKGKKGEVNQGELSAEQIQQLWMRRLQTTPTDFLRLKFAVQVEEAKPSRPQGVPPGGKVRMGFKPVFILGFLLFTLFDQAFGQTSLPWLRPEQPKAPPLEEVLESQLPLARIRLEGSGEVWVGQAVPMNVEVIVPTWFTGAPRFPEPEVPNAVTLSPEAAVNFVVQSGGKSFSAQGRRYLIFPQAEGKYTIPPAKVEVTFALPDGTPSPPKLLASPPGQFEAHMPPGTEGAKYFLTTDSLQIHQSLDRKPDGLKIGDSVTRTVTMTARNTVGISLPPLDFKTPEGIRLYPGMPKVTETAERGRVEASRIETVTYILEREGSYNLPEIAILWWNPQAKKMNKALLPAIDLKVKGNSGYQAEVFASSQEMEKPPDEPKRTLLDRLRGLLPWVPGVVGIVVLLLVTRRILSTKGISIRSWLAERKRRRAEAEAAYFRQFKKASLAGDASAALRHLMGWLDRTNPGPVAPTLEQFAGESGTPELLKGKEALNGLLFARPGKAEPSELQQKWSGRSFYNVVAQARGAQIRRSGRLQSSELQLLALNPGGTKGK